MKKSIALLLCGVLLVGLTACGKSEDKGSTATTQSTVTTTKGEETVTTTVKGDVTATTTGTAGAENPATTTAKKPTTAATTTTVYRPGGATVPIGTQPATTTTAPAGKPTATGGDTTATTTTTAVTTAPTASAPTGAQPYIALPAVGTDIDVTSKKDRIRVSAVAAWYNGDGSIGVSLTFKNYTSNWITEETNYVVYACYDKNGNVVQETRLWIGVIDTKKHPEKTYYFNVPADTAEVRLVDSKIVYWTEWS